jgi:hypothetical protein
MKKLRIMSLVFCTTLIVAFGSSAKPVEFNELTVFTFSVPVEIPGHEVLPARDLRFQTAQPSV